MDFSHFDEQGNAWMVDVGGKEETKREATARGSIFMSGVPEMVKEGSMKKGDVLGVARVAGIMGAKRTSELIPLCHLLNLTKLTVTLRSMRRQMRLKQSVRPVPPDAPAWRWKR